MLFKVVLLFLANAASMSGACELMDSSECPNYELVASFQFHVFVPRDKWEAHCTKFHSVFDCLYQPKYSDGCTITETYFYDMQRNSIDAICNDDHYMEHVDCLGNEQMQDSSKECLKPLFEFEAGCEHINSTRACLTNMVMTKCGEDDSKYMDFLAYRFLQPFAEYSDDNCHIGLPKIDPGASKTTTSTSMTTGMTTTSMTTGMTTTTTNRTTRVPDNTTVPSAASALAAPALFIAFSLTQLTLLFNKALFL